MDHPETERERPEEQIVTPSEVWEQLSPDVQARVCRLLARMAYKYAMSQRRSSSAEGGGGE
jgi:hypothetical protein